LSSTVKSTDCSRAATGQAPGGQPTLPCASRRQGVIQGLSTVTPIGWKSVTLRVTTVSPWTAAVAAISASRSGRGCGTWRPAYCRATAASMARMRPSKCPGSDCGSRRGGSPRARHPCARPIAPRAQFRGSRSRTGTGSRPAACSPMRPQRVPADRKCLSSALPPKVRINRPLRQARNNGPIHTVTSSSSEQQGAALSSETEDPLRSSGLSHVTYNAAEQTRPWYHLVRVSPGPITLEYALRFLGFLAISAVFHPSFPNILYRCRLAPVVLCG